MKKIVAVLLALAVLAPVSACARISPTTGLEIGDGRFWPVLVSIGLRVGKTKVGKKTVQAAGTGYHTPWGLQYADVLYEQLLYPEGAENTRLTALFSDALMAGETVQCGPVRSLRMGQSLLREEWDGALVYGGGLPPFEGEARRRLAEVEGICTFPLFSNRLIGYRTHANGSVAGNSSSVCVNQLVSTADPAVRSEAQGFLFAADAGSDPTAVPAASLTLHWGDQKKKKVKKQFSSVWAYNPQSRTYTRTLGGAPCVTRLGPESPQPTTPLVFDNLLVQYVDYEPQGTMALLNAALIGEGEALLFTRGVCIPCRWVRESYADRTRFISKSGRELALSTGKTYIAHFPTQQGAVIVE